MEGFLPRLRKRPYRHDFFNRLTIIFVIVINVILLLRFWLFSLSTFLVPARDIMEEEKIVLRDEDFGEALKEFGTYVDIQEDLKKLYEIAVKIARERCIHSWPAREIMTQDVVYVKRKNLSFKKCSKSLSQSIQGLTPLNMI